VRRALIATAMMSVAVVVAATTDRMPVEAEETGPNVVAADLTNPASKFVPINPVRVVDTRTDSRIKRLWNGSAFSIDPVTNTGVASRAGVSAGQITAVVINTTYVDAGAVGFGTVWPTGAARPFTSTNNLDFVGHTAPNLVIAPLGLDQKISAYASANSDVIIDVLGVFVRAAASTDGRFTAIPPRRAIDTREPGVPDLDAGQTITLDLRPFGVPADASAVVMNFTAVSARAAGFYRLWAADDPQPGHSNVNVLEPNADTGNQVITGIDAGRVKIFSSSGGGMVIDVTGYFTGAGATASTDGLFVPFSPGRLLDTRRSSGAAGLTGGRPLDARNDFDLQVSGRLDIPDGAAQAVALNLTATEPERSGFVKAYAAGTAEPPSSSLNTSRTNQTVPNHAITSVVPSVGRVRFESSMRTHLVVDATGYFLAPGATAPAGLSTVSKLVVPGSFDPAPLGPMPAVGPYDFIQDRSFLLTNGRRANPTIRVAWRACGGNPVLRYALNVDLAQNDQQIAAVIDAIEDIERYSGVDFRFGGVTSAGMNLDNRNLLPNDGDPYTYLPPDDVGGGLVDVVIGFASERDTPSIAMGVVGRGGAVFLPPRVDGTADAIIGFAIIDLDELVSSNNGPAGAATLRAIRGAARHEIGHLMGLAHVDEATPSLGGDFPDSIVREQLMYPSISFDVDAPELDFESGDILGLWKLYASQPGCVLGKQSSDTDLRAGIDLDGARIVSDT
jgi:hypothetical protein